MMNAPKQRRGPWIGLLLAGFLAVGCGEDTAPVSTPVEEEAAGDASLAEDVSRLVAVIESATIAESVSLGTPPEQFPSRIPKPVAAPTAEVADLRADFAEPPSSDVVAPLPALPHSLAIADDGMIVTGERDGARVWPNGAAAAPRLIAAGEVIQTQFDGTGKRLLLQTTEGVSVYTGPLHDANHTLEGTLPPGRAHWAGPDLLLFAKELVIDFNASAPQRVYTTAMLWRLSDGGWLRPWFDSSAYATLGTFPSTETVWGVPMQPHQIVSIPGPLLALNADGTTTSLTVATEHADLSPAATSGGDLLFVRTWKLEGQGSRVLMKWADSVSTPTLQLNREPARLVTASPSGNWIAFVEEPVGERPRLRRLSRSSLEAEWFQSRTLATQEDALRQRVATIRADLRAAHDGGQSGPTRAHAEAQAKRLRTALASHLSVTLPDDPVLALAALDGLLDQVGDYLPEDDATVVALGGMIAEAVPDARWLIEPGDVGLSPDVLNVVFSDDLSFSGLQPFALAREALAGRRRMAGEVAALRALPLPIYLVENSQPAVLERIQATQMKAVGIDEKRVRLTELADRLGDGRGDSRALNLLVYTMAESRGDHDLARRAFWPLVESHPAGAKGAGMLAEVLYDAFLPKESAALYQLAAERNPDDPALRFAWADALMAAEEYDSAEREFRRTALIDPSGAVTPYIQERLKILNDLRTESSP